MNQPNQNGAAMNPATPTDTADTHKAESGKRSSSESYTLPYRNACEKMGCRFTTRHQFVSVAAIWLADRWKDLHIEFHEHDGWKVSTCYANGAWGESSWLRGDGTLDSALLAAIEATPADGQQD